MRVLVADDDFTSRTLVTDVLREEGYDVVAVTDGAQADAVLRTADAPLIAILDWLMPRMDGIEVVHQTRARPTDNPPYLIMLTSKARRDDLLAGFAAGANDYLLKPFDLGELLARVAAGRRMVEMQTTLNDKLAAQHFQSQFHQIAAQISAGLTAVLDQAGFDRAVNTALRQLGTLFAADRSYLFRFTPDLAHMSNSHEWVAPSVASQIGHNQNLNADGLRWWKTLMLSKEPVQIPDTAALPPDAVAERALFLEQKIRSLICLPTIGGDGQLTGFIGFDMVNRTYEWSPEQIAMLQPIADAIGATIERLQTKEALGKSEIRYHNLFETARDAILITDDHQRYIEVNQAACDLLGYSRAELEALAVPDVMIDATATHKSWQTFITDGVQEGEATLRGKEGRLIPVEYRAVANFTPGRHFSVMRDVSERKRHEVALREAHSRYEALFTQTHDAVFILDLDCRLLQCNQQAADLLGYEMAEMYDLSAITVSTEPESSHHIHQKLLSGEHIPIYERQYRRKDGQIITVEVSAELVRDATGTPVHIQNIVRDISERKKMEQALRDSESRLRSYIEHAPYGLFIADEHGRYVEVNPAACTVTGYNKAELLNMNVGDLHLPVDYAAARSHFEQVRKTGFAVGEFTFQHKSGAMRYWLVDAIKLSSTRIMAFTQDITERKLAEENLRQSHAELADALETLQEAQAQLVQQERLAAVGQLAAGIAHDFNNILAAILLYAQMMNRASQLPPWETKAVAIIERQTQTAAQLVQQILDFSRRSLMEKRTLDWLPLLKEQVKLLVHTLPENIKVSLQAKSTGTYMVHADATRLQQMLLNLAVNARDAMPDGGELRLELDKLHLDAEQDGLPAGSWLRLRVSDTGQGITPENSQHIFEPFFTTKPPGQGSGLGLSQAQGIVLQHDGRIELSTAVGQGTIFTVYLPTVAEEVALTIAPAVAQSGQQETVLLVEDNDSLREVLVTSLQMLNYEVTAVGNGREALDYLQANPEGVDAILSDMIMPIMGGTELFQQVQRLARPVPMVIMTGHQMDEELDALMTQGLRGWLMKPLDFNSLANLLEHALS